MHYYKRIVSIAICNIFRADFNNHTRITPLASTVAWAHSVYNYLLLTSCSRDYEATRAHTERVHSPTLDLSNEGIFGSRKILSTTLLVMILNLVDEL